MTKIVEYEGKSYELGKLYVTSLGTIFRLKEIDSSLRFPFRGEDNGYIECLPIKEIELGSIRQALQKGKYYKFWDKNGSGTNVARKFSRVQGDIYFDTEEEGWDCCEPLTEEELGE